MFMLLHYHLYYNRLYLFFIGSNVNEFNGVAKREVSLATAFACAAANEAIADAKWSPKTDIQKQRTGC